MEVRDRILVESGLLFGKYGIRSMTMDSLAEELGISKRTIYERFKDKDTLLIEVIKYYKLQSQEEANRLIEQSDNVIEALFRIINMTIAQMMQLSPTFFLDFKKYHPKVYKEIAQPGSIRDFSITSKLLETGIQQEVFRDDINLGIVNRALHTLFDMFNQESNLVEAGYNRKEMFDQIIIPFFRGISTKKGRKLLDDCKSILEQNSPKI
ncbi:MAG: TetR/AcrR family transcriptional regulator [Bacteroidetes bacterium]|nr:TetR/AcrR family transcriptional regulator [Bacteroidota bacterium]